jgi:hypothetical protein
MVRRLRPRLAAQEPKIIRRFRPKAAIPSVLFSAQSEVEPHGKETGKLGEQQKYKANSPPRFSKNHHAYERHQKVGRCKD